MNKIYLNERLRCRKETLMELNHEELDQIVGGGIKIGLAVAIGGLISFIMGVVDGYLRPLRCNK